jgi:branched-chain amino acid transport system substrate-binding protein
MSSRPLDHHKETFMRRLALLLGLVLAAASAAGCGGGDKGSSGNGAAATQAASTSGAIPNGPIKVGMPIALTGTINLFDGDMLVGAKVAVQQINAKGGVLGHRLEIVTADTQSNIANGANAALDVIGKGAQFIIPTLDYDYGGAAARTAISKKLIAMSAAGDTRFGLKIGPTMFNLYQGSPTEGATMAQFVYSNKGWRKVYMLVDQAINHEIATCAGFKASFEKLGGKVVSEDQFKSGDASIGTQASRMRNAQGSVDGVVLCSFPPGAVAALKQLRGAGITKDIMLDQAMDGNSWEKGLSNTSGLFAVSGAALTPGETKNAEAARLFAAATKLTGKPNSFGLGLLTGYSAVQALADAVKAKKTLDSSVLKAYFETYKDKDLAIGPTTWTAQCHTSVGRAMEVVRFQGGVERYVTTVKPTALPDPAC